MVHLSSCYDCTFILTRVPPWYLYVICTVFVQHLCGICMLFVLFLYCSCGCILSDLGIGSHLRLYYLYVMLCMCSICMLFVSYLYCSCVCIFIPTWAWGTTSGYTICMLFGMYLYSICIIFV